MEADEGKRVTISFVCRYEDGTIYEFADRDVLEFVIGQGNTLPSLEKGVIGMHPGDNRTIRISAAEMSEYPFEMEGAPTDAGFPAGIAGPGTGYEFSPEEDGDLMPPVVPQVRRETTDLGADLYFDVEMISVQDTEVELEE